MTFRKILPLILYAVSLASSLPIISKPLENDSDHLVWEALLTVDTRNTDTRKVPKSIFITPNLNESKIPCPNGHKLGPDGKCFKTLNIDPLDILKTQIASLFNRNRTTIEYDEYDYSDYGDSTESVNSNAEQYDVPLSLGFADDRLIQSPRLPNRAIKDQPNIIIGVTVPVIPTERTSVIELRSDNTAITTDGPTNASHIANIEKSSDDPISVTTLHDDLNSRESAQIFPNQTPIYSSTSTESSTAIQRDKAALKIEIEAEAVPNLHIFNKFINGTYNAKNDTKSGFIDVPISAEKISSQEKFKIYSTSTESPEATQKHRFAISTTTNTIPNVHIVEQFDTHLENSTTETNDEIIRTIWDITEPSLMDNASTTFSQDKHVKPFNEFLVRNLSLNASHENIEIVDLFVLNFDKNNREEEDRNFTARLAEESLFQENDMTENTNFKMNTSEEIVHDINQDNSEIYNFSSTEIATQFDTLFEDRTEAAEESFNIYPNENQTNFIKENVMTSDYNSNISNDQYEPPILEDLKTSTEPPSIYTTLVDLLLPKHLKPNREEKNDEIYIRTVDSKGDWYKIATTTENYDMLETTMKTEPLDTELNLKDAEFSKNDTNQTIRLGTNCYLKNYLEHYYIMCT